MRRGTVFNLSHSLFVVSSIFDDTRYTRGGKGLAVLGSVADYLPPIYVDGEFWYELLWQSTALQIFFF